MEIQKFKEWLIRTILKVVDYEEIVNEQEFFLKIKDNYRFSSQREEEKILFSSEDFQKACSNICDLNLEKAALFNQTYYEVPLTRNRINLYINEENLLDDENGLKYSIGTMSPEYCLKILYFIFEVHENDRKIRNSRIVRIIHKNVFSISDDQGMGQQELLPVNFLDVLPRFFENTLKIESTIPLSIENFGNFKNSFVFNYMYTTGKPLIEYSDINSFLFFDDRVNLLHRNKMEVAPRRKYNPHIIDYYKLGISSEDPYIEFISYYHILEFFFDEVFNQYLVEDLKNKITHPNFSYKNPDKLLELAKFSKRRLQDFGENGQGNELESLKYVLTEFVNIDELKERLELVNPSIIEYYESNKVTFSGGPKLPFNDNQGIAKILAQRIYYTRNALVHSKSGQKDKIYRPYRDERILAKEIPLIKSIAEFIVIDSAEIIWKSVVFIWK